MSALWEFKQSFTNTNHCLMNSPWNLDDGQDFCSWVGVECDQQTGRVVGLDLNIGGCKFSGQLSPFLGQLTHLTSLHLSGNASLNITFSSMSWLLNLSKLNHLALNDMGLNGPIPPWLANLTKLVLIDLGSNHLDGNIPFELTNLTQLTDLLLGSNQLSGQFPSFITNLTQLHHLDLSLNKFHGSVPNSFFNLKSLQSLDLYSNNLSGTIDLNMFHNLKDLSTLDISLNNLSLLVHDSHVYDLPKQYKFLGLASCDLITFPNFLRNQDELVWLDLSNNGIQGEIPKWVWNSSLSTLDFLNISHNLLTRFQDQPALLPWTALRTLDISFNMIQESLPIPPPSINFYLVSNNKMKGQLSPLSCNLSNVIAIDVSYNNLTGTVPKCLGNLSLSLSILNLQGNNFSGPIPKSWTRGCALKMINLRENQFESKVPRSLLNCTKPEFMDLGLNRLDGMFPYWLGDLPELRVLCLRHNKMYGAIDMNTNKNKKDYQFRQLRILDLSFNNFSGKLPSIDGDSQFWNSMKTDDVDEILTYMQIELQGDSQWVGSHSAYYDFSMKVTNKGMKRVYRKIPNIFRGIDLSNNGFEGEVPTSFGNLEGLHLLTFGGNKITGKIPSEEPQGN